MKTNQILAVIAAVLLVLSIVSYSNSRGRAERFERGQKFITQLNADNISQIEITKADDTLILKRAEDAFEVATQHNYPAKNETINRFINDVLNISLEKKVGQGKSLEEELSLVEGKAETEVALKNDAGKTMVHFLIGKAAEDGRGNFIKRLDGDDAGVYLTSSGTYLSTGADSFLKKEILEVSADQLAKIQSEDFVIEDVDGSLKLKNVPANKKESMTVSQVKNALSGLRFESVYLADDPVVADLSFDREMVFQLKDESGYRVSLAQKEDQYFMKIESYFNVDRIQVSQEETEEELKKKSEVLGRADEVGQFNNFHGSWVYTLGETVAKKFLHSKKDLVEDEETES